MRKTFVFDKSTGRMVAKGVTRIRHMGVLPDIAEFQTTDGVAISSRSHLREYEKRTGLVQVGDDLLHGRNDDGSMKGRVVQEMPSARADVIEAFKRHS